MDNVVKKIRQWERIERIVNIGIIISIIWCVVMVIILGKL